MTLDPDVLALSARLGRDPLYLGLDIGTSGVRSAIVDSDKNLVSSVREPMHAAEEYGVSAESWWKTVSACLDAQAKALANQGGSMAAIRAVAIDGTSGTMVLVDDNARPVTPALMYDSSGFDDEATRIAACAPTGSIARGSGSALARMLRLQSYDPDQRARHLCHQADFILARLTGQPGLSDENNVLKLGYDLERNTWPDWFAACGTRMDLLPDVLCVGAVAGSVTASMAERFGFSRDLKLLAGTTDSVAAFLASGATEIGEAVTSLGTTLAIKLLSDVRVDDAARGIYSHRLGDRWLAGGASNTGGGALLHHFSAETIAALSKQIDPDRPTGFDYYPLARAGERFPVNDPALAPRLEPRPNDDAVFLQGMLEGMARIEGKGYAALATLGAPTPKRVLTAGGGARNEAWTAIRRRTLGCPVEKAPQAEASVGMALLARRGMERVEA
ncbi:FGGY-family carbohydrate kinase [Aurantimonas marina]|uniref:FGGY-family carbohydrate kinase n=1 Tax=Aurantimonas marina TaxID=2780508 RepID=UPI0019D22915|nr:FGGY-family carbohydrate kinase [Aurantimonas marina]